MLPERGIVSVPLFDSRCRVRHGCAWDEAELSVCLSVTNTGGQTLKSGTLHSSLGGDER